MKYIVVGFGGAVGSLTRYILGREISRRGNVKFPIGTFIINVTGAFFLGVVSSHQGGDTLYTLLGDGFLGAYTTFSTFMYEGVTFFDKNEKLNAVLYIIASLFLGILGFKLGFTKKWF